MSRNPTFLAALFGTVVIVSGCETTSGDDIVQRAQMPDEGATAQVSEATTVKSIAPEAFSKSEDGIWDGRPSLGGIWVAHPDVTEPRQVLIENKENGRVIVGALFKREREFPGPKLQISEDAANAIALLPGAPTPITVTAFLTEAEKRAAKQKVEIQMAALEKEQAEEDTLRVASAPASIDSETAETDEPIKVANAPMVPESELPEEVSSKVDMIADAEIARSIRLAEFLQKIEDAKSANGPLTVVAVGDTSTNQSVVADTLAATEPEAVPVNVSMPVLPSVIVAVQTLPLDGSVIERSDQGGQSQEVAPATIASVEALEGPDSATDIDPYENLDIQTTEFVSGRLKTEDGTAEAD